MLRIALLLIATQVAAGGDPAFEAITARVGSQSHDASCAQMQAWIDAHPSSPEAGRGLVWMAQLRLVDHRPDLALPLFERASREHAGTEWGLQGIKGIADIERGTRHFGRAIALYDQLALRAEPYWQYVGRMAGREARQERNRYIWFLGLAVLLLVATAFRMVRVRRGLWPVPEELTYALPIALLMLASSLTQPPEEAHAVIMLALGALVLLWTNGAYLRAHPPGRIRRIIEGLWGLAQAGALLYCAIIANDLWAKFAETLTSGADR